MQSCKQNPIGMSRVPFGAMLNDGNNRQEALNKAKKAQQMMMIQAEMMKQLQPTVPEVTGSILNATCNPS